MAIGKSGDPVPARLESLDKKMPWLSVRLSLYFHSSYGAIAVEHYDSSLYRASVGPYHFHFKLKVRSERRQADILVFNLLAFLQTY
jgi:hypothetical protein